MVTGPGRAVAGEQPAVLLVLWRARWLIALSLVLGAFAGYLISQQQPVRYTAQSRLVLGASSNFSPLGDSGYIEPSRYVANQISILTSSPVLERAIRLIDPETTQQGLRVALEELEDSVDATAAGDSDVITIKSTAPSAELAKERADALATAYRNFVGQQVTSQTERAIASTDDPARIATIQAQAALYGDGVAVFEPAQVPLQPSAPTPRRNAAILGAFAALLAAGWVLLRRPQQATETPWEVTATSLGIPIVGDVPAEALSDSHALGRNAGDLARARSAFETLLVGLSYLGRGGADRVMVTGAVPRSFTTGAARALATAAAEQGRRVLLVDVHSGSDDGRRADRRQPPSEPAGVTAVVLEAVDGRVLSRRVRDARGEDGRLLTVHHLAGPGGRGELERLADGADLVVLNAPPVPSSAVGFALAGIVDAVLLLVDDDSTGDEVALAEERIAYVGSRLAGVVAVSPRRRWWRSRDTPHVQTLPERPAAEHVEAPRETDDVRA